ncbi:DUF2865 domain-containing protein [Hoeflea ulvae]|uniref:DUF2865 domain-containing protein n=1 Tax=Hoeflea ulvae TaxID=2983764 RepID=A0ABT3YHS7_9HYPH|nr:DUF2865 domain-containing protein [Hoeflea ulvae]MCY0095446.1 DUF2865 domain-containing protein [Hoeflea ulvae]
MRRVWFRSHLLVLALALSSGGAAQASAVCTQLKAQLVTANSASGSSANYRRFAEAAIKQDRQIGKVRSDLRRYGCSSGSIIVRGGSNARACAKLESAHTKMRANLKALERKRDSYARRSNKALKRRIQAELKANDCDGKRASIRAAALKGNNDAVTARRSKSSGLVAILGDSGGTSSSRVVVEPRTTRGGNYRTLCVRSCDGFFFPVSSAASPSDFSRDERTCQMMCPGTSAELYFHSATGEESEDMISARTREPYSEMPNAFAYRNVGAPMSKACSCNMGAFYKEMQRREAILNGTATAEAPLTTWVRPFSRPDPGEDPETVLDAEMRLTSEDVAAVLAAAGSERPLPQERRQVRMVGPTFLPDQDEHLDLRAGGQPLIR